MRLRSKALTLIATMVAAFAILPALGAAADELPEDVYEVEVPEGTFGFEIDVNGDVVDEFRVDGDGDVVALGDDVMFLFESGEDGGVLNELQLVVGDVTYDVTIAVPADDSSDTPADDPSDAAADDGGGDGTYEVAYEVAQDDVKGALVSQVAQCALTGQDAIAAGLENHGHYVSAAARGATIELETIDADTDEMVEVEYDLSDETGVTAFCEAVEALVESDDGDETEPDEPVTEEDEPQAEEVATHGAIVSLVAECAPNGREARDAGLENHGFYVSATARGETDFLVVYDVEGVDVELPEDSLDLSTMDGAMALCDALDSVIDAVETAEQAAAGADDGDDEDRGPRGNRPDRAGDGPGKSGQAPGRTGEAPGQQKKNG